MVEWVTGAVDFDVIAVPWETPVIHLPWKEAVQVFAVANRPIIAKPELGALWPVSLTLLLSTCAYKHTKENVVDLCP